MYLKHYVGRALYRRGFDLYTLLTWQAHWELWRPRVIRVAVVVLFAWIMRMAYLTDPGWFGASPAFDGLGFPF